MLPMSSSQPNQVLGGVVISSPSPLERLRAALMSYKEYDSIQHPTPYTFELHSAERHLFYFGSPHIFSPDAFAFREICAACDRFAPDAILVECVPEISFEANEADRAAFLSSLPLDSREHSVRLRGEGFLGARLAKELGVHIECPEPNVQTMLTALENEGFTREQIIAMYGVRALGLHANYAAASAPQIWGNTPDEWCEKRLAMLRRGSNWSPELFSLQTVLQTAKANGVEVGSQRAQDLALLTNPALTGDPESGGLFNTIARAESVIRDLTIMCRISELTKTHRRVFVIFGVTHAVMQERGLRLLFSDQTKDPCQANPE